MPQPDRPELAIPKLLTPVGGVMLSFAVSGLLWGGVLVGMHVAGAF